MSIIHEALKKASEGKEPLILKPAPAVAHPKKPALRRKAVRHSPTRRKATTVYLVLSASSLAFCAALFFDFHLSLKKEHDTVAVPEQTNAGVAQDARRKTQDVVEAQVTRHETEGEIVPHFEKGAQDARRKTLDDKKLEFPEIVLSGVMMENPPTALVNGRIVKAGDTIEGVRIVAIHPDRVVFKYRRRKFIKWLF